MPLKRLMFLSFLTTLIFSCAEDESRLVDYPSLYHKSGVEAGGLRVFCLQGEIRDDAVVSRFQQLDTPNYYNFVRYVRDYPGVIDTVEFYDAKTSRVSHQYSNKDCSVTREGDLLVLTASNAIRECCFYGEAFTRSVRYFLGRVKPDVQSEFLYSSVMGHYYFGFIGRTKFVFQKSRGGLVAPFIQFTVRSGVHERGFLNNVTQPDFFRMLVEGDTITILESVILFKKI